jgi:hypothetical protein
VLSGVVSSLTTKLFPEPRFVMTTASLVAVAVFAIDAAVPVPLLFTVNAVPAPTPIVCGWLKVFDRDVAATAREVGPVESR